MGRYKAIVSEECDGKVIRVERDSDSMERAATLAVGHFWLETRAKKGTVTTAQVFDTQTPEQPPVTMGAEKGN